MRLPLLASLATLFLSVGAFAQGGSMTSDGQFFTVSVEKAPIAAVSATCTLGEGLGEQALRKNADGNWVGSFAVLPDMVSEVLRPEVKLFDAAHREVVFGQGEGAILEMAASEFDEEGLAAVASDRDTVFVFDNTVAAESIKLWTGKESQIARRFGANSFVLPASLDPRELSAVTARSKEGDAIVFAASWDVDLANVEEKL